MCDARSRGTEDWCEPAISLRLSGWTQEGTGMYTWLSMAWVQCTWDHYQLLHSRLSPHQAQTTKSCCCILMETLHLVLVQSGDQPLGPAFTDSVAPSPLMCIWGKEEKGSQELTMCSSFIGGISNPAPCHPRLLCVPPCGLWGVCPETPDGSVVTMSPGDEAEWRDCTCLEDGLLSGCLLRELIRASSCL
jgi:hypothetical protein